jgi:hypothetical protein
MNDAFTTYPAFDTARLYQNFMLLLPYVHVIRVLFISTGYVSFSRKFHKILFEHSALSDRDAWLISMKSGR